MILLQSRRTTVIAIAALAAAAALALMLVFLPRVLATDSEYTWQKWRLPWRAEAQYGMGEGCGYDDPALGCWGHRAQDEDTSRRYSLDLLMNRGNSTDQNNGVPVHSIGEGIVVINDSDSTAGNYLFIKTYDPDRSPPWVYAFYCHFREPPPPGNGGNGGR